MFIIIKLSKDFCVQLGQGLKELFRAVSDKIIYFDSCGFSRFGVILWEMLCEKRPFEGKIYFKKKTG